MKLTALITRLGEIIVEAKDPNIEVVFDSISYLHANQDRPHQLELVDVCRIDRHDREQRELKEEIQRLQGELSKYREAHG